MRKIILSLAALAVSVPAAVVMPIGPGHNVAEARAKVYRGRDGRYYNRTRSCRHSSGTTGLIAGGVGGAVLGNAVGGGLLGTIAGAGAGALGGRAIDRTITAKNRCR
ncbi:hypothetical protein [Sphingomonas sp.]|uniref:hypothetical protein n=1 Tax=Sphingomonas sp. TaxID=28214 RepID=UPI0025D06894|nr:hypothetical protein [Sphingomonas sp.]